MTLKYVTKIDYGAISILTAISDDLKANCIMLKGDFLTTLIVKNLLLIPVFESHV
jgi:hypothetical protein